MAFGQFQTENVGFSLRPSAMKNKYRNNFLHQTDEISTTAFELYTYGL